MKRAGALLIAVLSLLGLAVATQAASWPPADNLSAQPGRTRATSMAADPTTGDLFVTWMDSGAAQRDEILSRRWIVSQRAWVPPLEQPAENLSQSEWQDTGPIVFFDRLGRGLLVWTRRYAKIEGAPADGTDVLWRSWERTGWSDEHVLFHADSYLPSSYGFGLIPVETANGSTWFITWDTQVRIARYENKTWTSLSGWDLLSVSLGTAIADSAGIIHVAAFGENSSQAGWDGWFRDAYYLTYNGKSWAAPINLSYRNGVASAANLAFDAQGRLHYFWSDPDSRYSSESQKSALYERVLEGGVWTPNAEVTDYNPNQAINGFGLSSDLYGVLHLAWSEGLNIDGMHTDLDIYYRTGDGDTWGSEEKVFTSTALSRIPLVAISRDLPALAWEEGAIGEQNVFAVVQNSGPITSCQALSSLTLDGASTGRTGESYAFVAIGSPPTATLPVTYTWRASDQVPVVNVAGLVDEVSFSWTAAGTKTITVTAEGCTRKVTDTLLVTLSPPSRFRYLPLVMRQTEP